MTAPDTFLRLVVDAGGVEEFELDGLGLTVGQVVEAGGRAGVNVAGWDGWLAAEAGFAVSRARGVAGLSERAAGVLDVLARFLGQAPQARVRVEHLTDSAGEHSPGAGDSEGFSDGCSRFVRGDVPGGPALDAEFSWRVQGGTGEWAMLGSNQRPPACRAVRRDNEGVGETTPDHSDAGGTPLADQPVPGSDGPQSPAGVRKMFAAGTRFYLAGRYGRRAELAVYARWIEATYGWECTATWLTGAHDSIPCPACDHMGWVDLAGRPESVPCQTCGGSGDLTESDVARSRVLAQEDLRDVARADVVICATEDPGAPGKGRGGRHVELGYALAMDKIVVVAGPVENVFCSLAQVFANTIPDALAAWSAA